MADVKKDSPKHIVICCREWGTSTGRYVRNLVDQLQHIDATNQYTILLNEKDIDTWTPRANNFTKILCPYKEYSFGEQFGLGRMLQQLKPDIVHFTMTQQPILYRGKVVTTMHDLTTLRFINPSKNKIIFRIKQFLYGFVCRIAAKKSARIITPSQYVKQDVAAYTGVNEAKIHVTYEGSDSIVDAPATVAPLVDKPFILYVGRPNPHKNLNRLIEAFALLSEQYPDLVLALAGKKDAVYDMIEEKYKNRVSNLYFAGFMNDGQLRWLYKHCEAYVFPSLSEGFGLPGLEAMRHNAPVVSSLATCLPEIYGDAAAYFDPNDIGDMKMQIANVLASETSRSELIQKGARQVERYSWREMAEQTHQLYEDVLSDS